MLHTVKIYATRQYLERIPEHPLLRGFVQLAGELETIAGRKIE